MATAEKQSTLSKYIQFDFNTDAIIGKATEYLKPEKLTALLEEHKSGFIVAGLWLTICLRSWLSYLSFFSLSTLPLILLTLTSLCLSTPSRVLTGLSYYVYTKTSSSITSLSKKTLPGWLPRAIPIVLLFPVTRAAMFLSVLAVWEIVVGYRSGVASATQGADHAIHRAVWVFEKAGEHVREAKGLELQAMQLAVTAGDYADDNEGSKATINEMREVKKGVEGLVKEVGSLGTIVDKVKKQAEKAKMVAEEEGDMELGMNMVVNLEKLLEKLVQGEKKIGEKVEEIRGTLWKKSLGHGSGY